MQGPVGRRLSSLLTRLLRHRDMTILGGAAAGARINLGGSYLGYLTGDVETVVQETLAEMLEPGQVVYDIGANIGFFTIICSRLVGPQGRVYAFEPMPQNAVTLRHNVALNALGNTVVIEKAAASSSGTAELLVSEWSAFHALNVAGVSPPERSHDRITVETVTLDDFASTTGARPPDVVKIDVEGAELEVIKGMSALLASSRPLVICELHGTNEDFLRLIQAQGYEARTLGEPEPISEAHWNVHALAWPSRDRRATA
jgi:FkbM family methyltransferase